MKRRSLAALAVIVILLHAAAARAAEADTPTRQADVACSAYGLVAGTAAYSTCVADLTATLDQARRPRG
jgi:hypothetical protein